MELFDELDKLLKDAEDLQKKRTEARRQKQKEKARQDQREVKERGPRLAPGEISSIAAASHVKQRREALERLKESRKREEGPFVFVFQDKCTNCWKTAFNFSHFCKKVTKKGHDQSEYELKSCTPTPEEMKEHYLMGIIYKEREVPLCSECLEFHLNRIKLKI